MKYKSIPEALQYVADHPESPAVPVEAPMWELVSRALIHVANNPNNRVRGSLQRATKAQKMLLDRLVGRRRAGSHPAVVNKEGVDFVDLTVQELE